MKYEQLYNLTIENGGATVRLKDYPEKIVTPTKGFAVGHDGHGYQMPAPRAEFVTDPDVTETFDNLIERARFWFAEIGAEYLGTWVNDGVIYIDPVDVFATKLFALGVAWARGEQAIYDLAAQKEIRVKYA